MKDLVHETCAGETRTSPDVSLKKRNFCKHSSCLNLKRLLLHGVLQILRCSAHFFPNLAVKTVA
jgi:hypothetical protein